jgi:hypothetical protein
MDRAEVIELARVQAEPAVSVLCPVVQPATLHDENRLRLEALAHDALDRVGATHGPRVADQMRKGIDAALGDLTLLHAEGVALYATPEQVRLLALPFEVQEQVTIADSFATRQLLREIARRPPFRVLVLGSPHARLWACSGSRCEEVVDDHFPFVADIPREWDTPHRDRPIHEGAEDEAHRVFCRAVDAALADCTRGDRLPVVVVGVQRELAYFAEVTHHDEIVVATVAGSHLDADGRRVEQLAAPAIGEHLARRAADAASAVREGVGRGHAVTGVTDVLEAARDGRGHLLVVEDRYTFPEHLTDDLLPGEGPDPELGHDDLVDDIIEKVLVLGGDVVFAPDGGLGDLGQIGLIVRY